jgi:hypothetical protein
MNENNISAKSSFSVSIADLLPPPEPWIKYQHINWWSYSKMQKMLAAAGFNNITKTAHGTSAIEDANEFDKEANRSTYSLYIECEK